MSDDKWNAFASTGKISDYLEFKGINLKESLSNGDINANGNENNNTYRTCNP